MQVAILGRQPSIGKAELESLFGPDSLTTLSKEVVKVASNNPLPQLRLGGTIKSGEILTTLDNNNIEKAYEYIFENIVELIEKKIPEGKVQFGISIYGQKYSNKAIFKKNLEIKKLVKESGRSIRIIENKKEYLETAQVLHNKLAGHQGLEIIVIRSVNHITLALTTGIQNIDSYAKRDQGRPKRDPKVGMLPPKLAQIIINLTNPEINSKLLDPFCGTGVLLQEASLMNLEIFGSDIQERMIEYTIDNLIWLSSNSASILHNKTKDQVSERLSVGDATKNSWQPIPDVVACETYLGKPLTSLPPDHILKGILAECDRIHTEFLRNIGRQLKPGTKLCLAVPAWKTKNGFLHLKTLDYLADLGYTRRSFVHATTSELIYHRPDQTVARELVVLEKI